MTDKGYDVIIICSDETIIDELSNIHSLLSENCYTKKFINKHMNEMKRIPKVSTVPKKVLFLKVQFLNNATEKIVTQGLRKVVQKSLNAAKPKAVFQNHPIIKTNDIGRLVY